MAGELTVGNPLLRCTPTPSATPWDVSAGRFPMRLKPPDDNALRRPTGDLGRSSVDR